MAKNSTASIKRRIMKQRGVQFKKDTRKPVTYDDLPAPYHKTSLMKYVELKFQKPLKDLIFDGTIYELEKRLGVDATTISKWRRIVSEAEDKAFWKQFRK